MQEGANSHRLPPPEAGEPEIEVRYPHRCVLTNRVVWEVEVTLKQVEGDVKKE
jgi:hypothetical protein